MKTGLGSKSGPAPIYDEGMHPGVFVVPLALLVTCAVLLFAMSMLVGPFVAALRGVGGAGQSTGTGLSWLLLIPAVPVGVLVAAAFVVVGMGFRTTRVQLTKDRLRLKTGFFSRNEAEISIADIESVILRRPPLGRMLGYGTVLVIGRGGTPFDLAFLPQPERLHQGILDLRAPEQKPPPRQPPPEPTQDDSRYRPR